MTESLDLTPPSKKKGEKKAEASNGEAKPKKERKPPSVSRSNFAKLYPEDAALTVLVEKNPKKEGSKSRARFEHYSTSKTVGEFLAKGGTYGDIAYDVGRGHIKVG